VVRSRNQFTESRETAPRCGLVCWSCGRTNGKLAHARTTRRTRPSGCNSTFAEALPSIRCHCTLKQKSPSPTTTSSSNNRQLPSVRPPPNPLHTADSSVCCAPRSHHGDKRSRVPLLGSGPGGHRLRPVHVVHLRRQGRHAGRHLRPAVRSQGDGDQRGHALPHPVAAKGHHLRRAHQAAQHPDDDGQQGSPDGQPDAAGAAPPGCADASQDLPGAFSFCC
jgi:hypothetical protein